VAPYNLIRINNIITWRIDHCDRFTRKANEVFEKEGANNMSEKYTDNPEQGVAPRPNPDLKDLDRMVGTWEVSGGAQGRVTYEWMEGGFFLMQHVDLEQYGTRMKGIEIIGHEQPFGAAPGEEIRSRYYDSLGNTLDYVYELQGDTLMIWGGEKGSPAYYKGKFSEDDRTVVGEWVYPEGGGYASTMTRVRE
jgi:hypothetical protein